ncbi:MAG TPA: bifunctional aldolase/short-chain dehydrogenase [Polyangiaceae bacterium]|jgi:rhamnose utilization protein RhaD (predicted bifunctional aldolase and dehydrogenase)/NAD(P)-dependent dehydrogenase (short-subunit alcohol dehydrogenase family)
MQSLYNPEQAALCATELALRVYTSQLLGRDDTLVLHGGGNTSLKVREHNLVGEEEEILYVKGSGWDLVSIQEAGFAPVRMAHLLKLARLEALSDPQMVNELGTQVTRAGAPGPSVEAILHAILPHRFVDHTHADAVLAVTNTRDGAARVREIFGDEVVIIPYVMPGFDLARLCAKQLEAEAHARTIGMVLLNHGIFSFGATAQESYERMIALVGRAEAYLARHKAWELASPTADPPTFELRLEIATLRQRLSTCAGFPLVLATAQEPRFLAFARRSDVATVSQQGPATPDHVLRTKRLPMLGRDVDAYARAYAAYFERNAPHAKEPKTPLDAAPRVILDPELGLATVGRSAKDARIVRDIYAHTIDVILRATALGGYQALPEKDLFDVEYWDLEQAKLKRAGSAPVFAGEVALVTGAASGIGKACVAAFLKRGAAVIALDLNPEVTKLHTRPDFLGLCCDVTSLSALRAALETGVRAFGGLDLLVLNAGIFPGAKGVAELTDEEWRRVMSVNLDANLALLRECHPLLKLAPRGGRAVVIGSKNVPAPGPGAAAYSASKAALTQLARVTALEWGRDRIRMNVLHPNAVFDTGLWTEEVLASRAKSYGMSVAEYKTHNVLKVEVTSQDVAELCAELCGPLFAKTTGLQIPIDGGNERVI